MDNWTDILQEKKNKVSYTKSNGCNYAYVNRQIFV